MNKIQFEDLPIAVTELLERVSSMQELLKTVVTGANETDDQPLTIKGASNFLNCSVHTVYKLVQKKAIPYSKKGKCLIFFKSDLLAWIREGKKITAADLQAVAETDFINANKNRR